MKIKWTLNGVSFARGNYRPIIARFDNSRCWFRVPAMTTTTGARSEFRALALEYGAKSVELKYFYDDEDQQTETNVVDFLKLSTGYIFRNELNVPPGSRRQFVNYQPETLFLSL